MKIALLNERIQIQKSSVIVDNVGNHTNGWADFYACFATVGGESGTEEETATVVVERSDITFTVRYAKIIDAITSTGYRILFRGEIYNIVSIDHRNYKKKSVKFKCRRAER